LDLVFHGAAREVGRSCIEVFTQGDRYLLDCGIKFTSSGFSYPEEVFKLKEIDGVIISHSHLDHIGGLPLFEHHDLVCPIFMTPQTSAIGQIMLKDSYEIAKLKKMHDAYEKMDLRLVKKRTKVVDFDKWYQHRKIKFKFLNAGHIPGSAMTFIEAEGKKLLYSGDINTRTTKLMSPANPKAIKKVVGDVDVLITESTYGNRTLPKRSLVEKNFVAKVKEVIARGGIALVPVFALGRSQEILIILGQAGIKVPIYFDGMGKQLTRKILTNNSSYVINKDLINDSYFKKVQLVGSQGLRTKVSHNKKPCIIITTSGMLQGGPVGTYLKELWHEPKNAVLLTGYQVKGTNGWKLLNEGKIYLDGWLTDAKCEVEKFDFSGHADIKDIQEFVKTINPKILVVQHGDEEAVDNLAQWAVQNTSIKKVYGPRIGEKISVDKKLAEIKNGK